jgi:hypothetical protein
MKIETSSRNSTSVIATSPNLSYHTSWQEFRVHVNYHQTFSAGNRRNGKKKEKLALLYIH